jgi:hypothetical protein
MPAAKPIICFLLLFLWVIPWSNHYSNRHGIFYASRYYLYVTPLSLRHAIISAARYYFCGTLLFIRQAIISASRYDFCISYYLFQVRRDLTLVDTAWN